MILLTHILIALTSIAYTALTFFVPSKNRIKTSSWLVGLTLATGTVLVINTRSGLMQACATGLIYLSCNVAGIMSASRKLAAESSHLD